MRNIYEQWRKLLAPPRIATSSQGAQSITVIALTSRDKVPPLWLAYFNKILAGKFNGGFGRLRATGNELDPIEFARSIFDQQIGQCFGRLRGKKTSVSKLKFFDLFLNRSDNLGITMTKAGHCCST